jgi:hypothetical protein
VQGEVLRAEDRLDPDRRAGLGAEPRLVLDLEGDLDVVAVQVDLLDLADLDPGDPHLVARLETARLREGGAVRLAVTDHRQAVGVERGHGQQREDGESDGADDDGVALAEGAETGAPEP